MFHQTLTRSTCGRHLTFGSVIINAKRRKDSMKSCIQDGDTASLRNLFGCTFLVFSLATSALQRWISQCFLSINQRYYSLIDTKIKYNRQSSIFFIIYIQNWIMVTYTDYDFYPPPKWIIHTLIILNIQAPQLLTTHHVTVNEKFSQSSSIQDLILR